MACCGGGQHSWVLHQGDGIIVTGSGTPTDPWVVSSAIDSLADLFRVVDTPTVNLTLTGGTSSDDPLTLRAASILKLTDLADVEDPGGGPAVGESPVWVGSGADGHWEFLIPPPAPAGATNVDNGLSGIGSVGDPVVVNTSGEWGVAPLNGLGSDSTIGDVIYVDSNGDLRAAPTSAPSWASITGKPATFPPSAHTHVAADITDQSNLNAGKVNGVKVTSTPTSATPPTSPSDGDLWFFPKDS